MVVALPDQVGEGVAVVVQLLVPGAGAAPGRVVLPGLAAVRLGDLGHVLKAVTHRSIRDAGGGQKKEGSGAGAG